MEKDKDREKEAEDEEIVSVGLKATYFNSLIDRFFTKTYINKGQKDEQYIFIHSNGIVICGIGENNEIVKNKSLVEVIDLGKIETVRGKKKHGAKILQENEYIIELKIKDGDTDRIVKYAPKVAKAKLMEINSNLKETPSLVYESPEKFGYLCMLFLDLQTLESYKNRNSLN